MATNPLFHSYNLNKTYFGHNIYATNQMAQRAQLTTKQKREGEKQHDPAGQPQTKKRRVDNPAPDETGDWDDLEFTQQDLENLDVIASQAMGGGNTEEASTSRQHRDQEQTLELDSASVSVAEHDQSTFFQAPAPGATLRLKNRASTSSGSESSAYPQSSSSLRKTPSWEVSSAAGSLTRSSSSSGDNAESGAEGRAVGAQAAGSSAGRNGAAGTSAVSASIAALRDDLTKKAMEAQKARSELFAKEGEVKYLKEALHKQEQELERLRAQREERKDTEDQRQKEREKEQKQEIERLQTRIQFQAQEFLQLQERCQTMESKLQQQAPSPSRPQASTSTTTAATPSSQPHSPSKSPRLRKVQEGRGSQHHTPEKGAFPSVQSFLSPMGRGGAVHSVGTMTVTAEADPGSDSAAQPCSSVGGGGDGRVDRARQRNRRLRLSRASFPGQRTPGARLVSQLLSCRCGEGGEVEDSGIVGLLHALPSRHDLAGLKYQRDSTTSRLSPIKMKRRASSPGPQTASKQQSSPVGSGPQPVVRKEHFLLAMHGLRQLVESTGCRSAPNTQSGAQVHRSGAVLLLPLLNDYIQHYIDILTSSDSQAPTSPNVSSSSNKSSSVEGAGSSLESVTSSLGVLMQQGAQYASNVEVLALCALRVLNSLLCACGDVRAVLAASRRGGAAQHLKPQAAGAAATTDTSSSTVDTDHEKEKRSESGMEGDDEHSTGSSKGMTSWSLLSVSPSQLLADPQTSLQPLNLLHKVLRLAAPSQEGSGFNVSVVEAALDVLNSLVVRLPTADVDRLQVIVLRGVLSECLQLEHQPGVTVRALDLFSCLVRSRSLLPFLCTKAGMSDSCSSCTLLNIHMVLTRLLATCRGSQQLQPLLLSSISKVMDAVSAVVSFHRNGVHILTDNNCRCSGQIIPSLVHAMFYLLRDYQSSANSEVFTILHKGVLLLHEISLRDPNFQQRYGAVLPHYCTLMAGLTRLYRGLTHLPALEANALEDLLEELDESDTYSQDSDHEEHMSDS